jgi:hypothetical protein
MQRASPAIAALTARGQSSALTYYFNQAIENGVEPSEISETITHLAYYSGWGNAFAAVAAANEVFAQRGVGADQLPAATVDPLPLDEASEAKRTAAVGDLDSPSRSRPSSVTATSLYPSPSKKCRHRAGRPPKDRAAQTVTPGFPYSCSRRGLRLSISSYIL